MTIPIENLEEIAIGHSLAEVADLLNEAVGDSDPASVEYWPHEEELVVHIPLDVESSVIDYVTYKMMVEGMLHRLSLDRDGDELCARYVDAR